MSRDPLFTTSSLAFEDHDFFKYAQEKGVKMPEDETQWEQAISDHVAAYMPYVTQYPVSIEFDEKDPKQGYAKGRLDVSNQISIPLIMQNFRLMPLDVMTVGDHFEPLSERALNQILLPRNLAAKPVSKEDSKTVPTDLDRGHRPPYSAYANRNAGYKTASILDKIEIDSKDIEAFRDKLAMDHITAMEAMSRAPRLFEKLAARAVDHDAAGKETVIDRIRKIARAEGWPVNVMQLSKKASGELEVAMSSDHCPIAAERVTVDVRGAANMFGADAVKRAMADEPTIIEMGRSAIDAVIPDDMQFPLKPMSKFGQYDVITHEDKLARGYFVPEVYSFGMDKRAESLFIGEEEHFMQEKMAGKAVSSPSPMEPCSIGHGDTGSFLFEIDGKVAATIPVTVTNLPSISDGKTSFEGFSMDCEQVSVDVIDGIKTAMPGDHPGHYYVPSSWKWAKLGSYGSGILDDPDGATEKVAACLCDHQIDITWDGVNYKLSGPQVNSLPKPMDQLEPDDALFTLTSYGLSEGHVRKAMDSARAKGKSSVFAQVYPTGRYEVISNAFEYPSGAKDTKLASANADAILSESAGKIRSLSLIKEALVAEDEDTVDNVLALNFVTPQNIQQYVENIDDFKGTTSKLAHLLVATRLGMRPIDPVAVKTAMENMSQVVEELEVLRSSLAEMGKQQKK